MTTPALHLDFETRSAVDLREVGLYNYARHPDTSVWCMSWAIGDDDPYIWTPLHPMPERAAWFVVKRETF